ncbi:MAG: hypothetical protein ACKO9Q_30550, partial [Pirellula sp.]
EAIKFGGILSIENSAQNLAGFHAKRYLGDLGRIVSESWAWQDQPNVGGLRGTLGRNEGFRGPIRPQRLMSRVAEDLYCPILEAPLV